MKKFNDLLMIKEAAQFLGVTESTLRNWGNDKKIKEYRHPINQYRLYDKNDLIKLLGIVNNHVTTLEYDPDYYQDQIKVSALESVKSYIANNKE